VRKSELTREKQRLLWEELEMKINEFKENNETKKEVMDQKMEALKLENINSMWYFIVATLKAVVGSKGH